MNTAVNDSIRRRTEPRNLTRGRPLFSDEPATLPQLFLRSAGHNIDNALNYKRDGKWNSISSVEMVVRARNIALGLYSLGMRPGDRAAILAANSPEWTLADAGTQFAGIVDVPLYTTLSPAAIRYILIDCDAKVLFVQNDVLFSRISDILPECSGLEKLVFFDPGGAAANNELSLAGLENEGAELGKLEPLFLDSLTSEIGPNDVATLIYTSGTTGEPKGVMLSHSNIISNVIDAGEKYSFSHQDVSLSVLPLSHIFERTGMYVYLYHGMAVHYAESIEKVPENLQEVHPTLFIGVPRIFEKVYASAKLRASRSGKIKEGIFDWAIEVAKDCAASRENNRPLTLALYLKNLIADRVVFRKLRSFFGGRLRFCITGGAALSDTIYLIFTGAGIPIMQGYGLTETSPVISSNNPSSVKVGTVGKPIRNVQVRLAADGEIETIGPGVMLGYYKKEAATNEAFTPDGWFRTGDIGTIDADGFIRITDRKKELFKTSGGKYVAPSPIEQMILSSRFVNQVVLVGSERKFPAALIVPNFEQLASYAEHKGLDLSSPEDFCKSGRIKDLFARQIAAATADLSQFEKVKKFELLEREFSVEGGELTPTLKIKRRVIDEKYKDLIEKIYSDADEERPASF